MYKNAQEGAWAQIARIVGTNSTCPCGKLKLNVLTRPTSRPRSDSKRAHSLRFHAEHQRLYGSQWGIFKTTDVSVRNSPARTAR